MNATTPLSVADRFGLSLDGLCRAVAARIAGGALSVAMIVVIWGRVRRVKVQMLALLARFQAGRLRVCQARQGGGSGGGRGRTEVKLPLRFGWLLPLVPYEAACFAGQVRTVLDEPEMMALLEASPQARRVMRPLCRMLGMEVAVLGVSAAAAAEGGGGEVAKMVKPRVRKQRAKPDWGRIPLPRGVLSWARREGFGKV